MPGDLDLEFRLTLEMNIANAAITGVKRLEGIERKMLVDHLMAKIKQSNWVISSGEVTSFYRPRTVAVRRLALDVFSSP